MKEHAELEVLVTKYNEYKKLTKEIADAKEMLNEKLDKEFREMVETELKEAQEKLEDVVCLLYGGQPVGYHNNSAGSCQFTNRFLDFRFRFDIN